MTIRIVVGAAGLIGNAITRHAAAEAATAVAVDPALAAIAPAAQSLRMDATGDDFAQWLPSALSGHERAELYYAAGQVTPLRRVVDTSPTDFGKALDDLVSAYTVTSRFAEASRQAGVPASIVIIGSVGAHHAHRYLVGYDAARAGLESIARSLALEYGPYQITTRVLAVGPVAESATTQADGNLLPALVRLVPMQRYATVDQIAAAAIAYGAPAFDCANGHTLCLDGGLTIQLRPADIERRPEQ
jgi:gluconate 5-dehydrogenase